jgi:hypothetical protein
MTVEKEKNEVPKNNDTAKPQAAEEKPAVPLMPASVADSKDTQPHAAETKADSICLHRFKEECRGHQTGLLTAREIKEYDIVKDRDDINCLQTTSYDLRLGEGHMVYNSVSKKWEAIWVGDDGKVPNHGATKFTPIPNGVLTIPALGMALIQLREDIDLLSCTKNSAHPVFICGHFDLKLKRVVQGLISQQATQVEPGYQGKLFCYLFNHTGDEVQLDYSDDNRVATIEFQYVSCIAQCDRSVQEALLKEIEKQNKKYVENQYCGNHGIKDVRYFERAKGLPKHSGLTSLVQRLNDVKNEAVDGCKEEITIKQQFFCKLTD